MNKLIAVFAVAAVSLAVPAGASAQQYVLKHPKREHCRVHYVRKVETVKVHGRKVKETVCVYHAPAAPVTPPAPAPEPTSPPASAPALTSTFTLLSAPLLGGYYDGQSTGEPSYFAVEGTIGAVGGADLIGTPITFAITNQSSGQTLGSFTWPSTLRSPAHSASLCRTTRRPSRAKRCPPLPLALSPVQ